MVLYDFRCTKCKYEFEDRISIKDLKTAKITCPKCNSEAERLITGLKSPSSSWRSWRT